MKASRAIAVVILILVGCSKEDPSRQFDNWGGLDDLGNPVRSEKTTWPVDDRSCITPDDIQVFGELDAKEFSAIVSEVQRSHPRVAILWVRRSGNHADVLTGSNCTSPGTGGGDIYFLRFEGMRWQEKGTTQWH